MKLVRQVHMTGCGVATMAMLTGTGYQKALRLVHPKRKPGSCACTSLPETLAALEKAQINYRISFKRFKLRSLKHNAELSYRTPSGGWHAIVWDAEKQRILDPGKPNGRTKLTDKYLEKHTRWFIEIL